ncbi:MAG: nucleotidyltransferase family protein [Clostridiales bacterium]|jgi:predicted nucleotidyltransferase|nr:nucleotidyltransferase family protein [Clostridiales bacterium]
MTGAVGFAAEFNPFHNGHKYFLDTLRDRFPGKPLVAVMSGNFVQRGEPALIDKFSRAQTALRLGADVLLELPARYALSSAEFFARGSVSVVAATGVCDVFAFGSETGAIEPIAEAADAALRAEADPGLPEKLRRLIREGIPYAAAYGEVCDEFCAALPRGSLDNASSQAKFHGSRFPPRGHPNDTLGVEYLKAIRRVSEFCARQLEPFALRRGDFASASDVRRAALSGAQYREMVPAESFAAIGGAKVLGRLSLFSDAIRYALTRSEPDGGLERRISAAAFARDADGIVSAAKSRTQSEGAVRRAMLRALIGIGPDECRREPDYIRVLGFRSGAERLVGEMSRRATVPVVVGRRGFSDTLETELRASDLYYMYTGGCRRREEFYRGVAVERGQC